MWYVMKLNNSVFFFFFIYLFFFFFFSDFTWNRRVLNLNFHLPLVIPLGISVVFVFHNLLMILDIVC